MKIYDISLDILFATDSGFKQTEWIYESSVIIILFIDVFI